MRGGDGKNVDSSFLDTADFGSVCRARTAEQLLSSTKGDRSSRNTGIVRILAFIYPYLNITGYAKILLSSVS